MAPPQGWSLLAIGPFLDYYVVGLWVLDYRWSGAAVGAFAASCTLAVGVNLSQFMCLGRFSAISYRAPAPSACPTPLLPFPLCYTAPRRSAPHFMLIHCSLLCSWNEVTADGIQSESRVARDRGRTEVLGHGKTALVLFGGWAFLGETVTARQVGGMTLAMCGMIAYGYCVSQCAPPPKPPLPGPTRS